VSQADAWSLRRRVNRSIVAVLVLFSLLVLLVVYSMYQLKETGDEVVDRWDPAAVKAQTALAAMVNQETGVRGFALGEDEQFLDPYTTHLELEEDASSELRTLVRDDEDLLALLDAFEAATDDWREAVADPVIATVRDGDPGALDMLGSPSARDAFDRIRDTATRLADGIDARRSDNIDAREAAFDRMWLAIGFVVTALFAAGALLSRGLRRSVLAPIDSLATQTREVAEGDLGRHIEPTGPAEIVDLGRDVDVMRARLADEIARVERARIAIERRSAELARSNADLEQFAYVASHDLSEPLRKVTNFCQLLERQYGDQLDDKARQYIAFMVDGAKRMQALINDLLAFSRVGRTTEDFVDVDLDRALTQAMSTLEEQVRRHGVEVVREPLPTVPGDATLLTALLQNLVGNAVKYRDEERPQRITVSAEQVGDVWRITIDDEGIGIERQYADRIFAIFQRLHLRDQYGGTGIGLALCRKIVDFHGGRIWLAEKDGPGARFQFTLPVSQAPSEKVDADEPAPLAAT
jgi:signal transduction histidine kinase